ncbi:S41 family peptidase [Lysobacter sp. TY2-98]|uniref:S41 family peptidase n=1 Tax=Lysobacter sp. TY2-98 TaxID=2290922 RepID=UPI000E1FF3D4|nr:S41 family peptidase [Lysobacter sp. TY2-98]AXK73004.1 S41 family peptidase [Lysobacter sp. TY2-98]
MRRLLVLALLAALPAAAQQAPAPATPQPPATPPKEAPATPAPASDPKAPASTPATPAAKAAADVKAEEDLNKVPLDDIRRFVTVYNAVKQAYVEPVTDQKLMKAAIHGLLLDLDPHSTYFDKTDAEDFDENARGAYEGIGVELQRQKDGTLKVVSAIDDTPAAKAGLKSGDIIVAMDGKPFGPDAGDTSAPLRGPAGSKVVLTVVRKGAKKPLELTVVRDTIHVTSVRSRMLEPGFGYVRVAAFQADTAADFEKALDKLTEGGALRGLVLDLRSNPGGLLTSAVQIADDLLDKGGIVSTRGRIQISDAQFAATPGDRLKGAPLVVLVDGGSASASEVLAGALKDNGRARIVGSRTFGKGSVQTVLPLDNGDSVKLTTARYFTPSGKSIQALGIVPDVPFSAPRSADDTRLLLSEASLPGHLRGDADDNGEAGDVLDGPVYIQQALAEVKRMAGVPVAAAPAKPAAKPAPKKK